MKNATYKNLLKIGGLGLGIVLLSGCTANFCSNMDQASIAYPYEQGATVYLSKADYDTLKAGGTLANGYGGEAYKNTIAFEEEQSAAAKEKGLPVIAGPAFVDASGNAIGDVYKFIPATFAKKTVVVTEGGTETETQVPALTAYTLDAKKIDLLNNTVIKTASSNGYRLPSIYYFGIIDDFVLQAATVKMYASVSNASLTYESVESYKTALADTGFVEFLTNKVSASTGDISANKYAVNPYEEFDTNGTDAHSITDGSSILREKGAVKFSGKDSTLYGYYDAWNQYICENYATKGFYGLDEFSIPSQDFITTYKNAVTAKYSQIRSCIATRSDYYGHYGSSADWRVAIEQKDWGYAWSKGFLEGLFVYPVSWLVDTFAYGMDPTLSGMGQIWALVFVTLIVRGLLLLISFRSTMDSQKMQALQPELSKIQAKYPNANTNQSEKQRLSQEQMALYRRHGVKPFRQMLMLVVQFPVFICVWSGLQGAASLATGEVLNLRLSDNLNTILMNFSGAWYTNATGWWTAAVLFLLMAAAQVMSMMLPRIIAKVQNKNAVKLSKNPAADQQGKTMKYMQIFMMVFTIIMGFMLPSAMGIYWFISALVSMIQTGITQLVLAKGKKKKGK